MDQVMHLYDAHNHLHDERLKPWREELLRTAAEVGVTRMVVNGSCEDDWPDVFALARQQPMVLPSFGYHPWYVQERTPQWQQRLIDHLNTVPSAVGEIGLDRWILNRDKAAARKGKASGTSSPPAPLDEQVEVFVWQLRLAAERNLPVSIHCLQAWGSLHEILRWEARPACGFLLHSYGGPVEMIKPLADLGAYFSLPGYFAHERKHRQRETFRHVPLDRLLIETDAPDQCLPEARNRFPLNEMQTGYALNHPANLAAVYDFAATLLHEPVEALANRVQANFLRLFGGVA